MAEVGWGGAALRITDGLPIHSPISVERSVKKPSFEVKGSIKPLQIRKSRRLIEKRAAGAGKVRVKDVLMDAIQANNVATVKSLINVVLEVSESHFYAACQTGNVDIVKEVITGLGLRVVSLLATGRNIARRLGHSQLQDYFTSILGY